MVGGRSLLRSIAVTAGILNVGCEESPGCPSYRASATTSAAVAPITGRATRQFSDPARRNEIRVSHRDPGSSVLNLPTTLRWKDSDAWTSGLISAAMSFPATFEI